MSFESRPGSITGLPDDQLATAAVSLVVSELEWTPDVAPAVMDRISRDAVAYPEHFDRRLAATRPSTPAASGRSARRTLGRLAVFLVILIVIVVLVVFAATADAGAASDVVGAEGARVPNAAMRGTLVVVDVEPGGERPVAAQSARILHVVTEDA